MPTYRFRDNDTGEEFEKWMLMDERESFLKDNPNIKQLLTPPNFVHTDNYGEGWRGKLNKQHPDWKEVMKKVKSAPGSTTDVSPYL